jgi:hypothetical protein
VGCKWCVGRDIVLGRHFGGLIVRGGVWGGREGETLLVGGGGVVVVVVVIFNGMLGGALLEANDLRRRLRR